MRVLLASLSIETNSRFDNDSNAAYPLGLAYLYSVLEEDGNEVKLLFLNNYDYEYSERKFFECLEEYKPQVVGFQIFSMNRVSTFVTIEKMKNRYPQVQIIVGGIHTSIMYEQIVTKYPGVIAIIGEGENTVSELIKAFELGNRFDDIDGIAFFKDNHVVQTKQRELIEDLDRIPFPKHEVFFENEPSRKIGHIISSRGCPYNCSFCCLKLISQRRYRKRNILSVVEEIKYLKRRYPQLEHIQFHDDTFLLDNSRVIKFCKTIIEENLKLTFECSARVKPISSDMFYWMEKAGFKKIMFGLETGSEKLLKSIHKNISKKDVMELFETLKPFKFTITTFLMCGFPGENDNTISETIKLVKETQKIKYNWIAGVGKLWVYPGTEVYNIMKKHGRINDDFWLTEEQVPYYTVEHSLKKLIEYENRIMDCVSISRIFTFRGFRNQFLAMPLIIIKYIMQNRDKMKIIISSPIELYFPNLYRKMHRLYKKIRRRT